MAFTQELRERKDVPAEDAWDLTPMFASEDAWRQAFENWKKMAEKVEDFRGKLGDVETLVKFFEYEREVDVTADRLGVYAYLKAVEDVVDPARQTMKGEFSLAASKAAEAASFVRPELLALSEERWAELLKDAQLAPWKLKLERILRYKPHSLSAAEEKLLAAVGDVAGASSKTFRVLNDGEMDFGMVADENGKETPLTPETFQVFLHSPVRSVRKEAFEKFYAEYAKRQNTLASTLEGSIRKDVFYAKARNFESSLEAATFSEAVPSSVCRNLVETVRAATPALYRYYDLRRRAMNLDDIRFYDVYTPILSDVSVDYSWDAAVELIGDALSPLGEEYVKTLTKGLTTDRWADKYQNKNKQSGAFSYGGYDFPPYIMMNYKPNVIESVFTLAHEGGHSMHSWYSARTQPYEYHDYTIFLAEIASTFNEQLLARRLLEKSTDSKTRAWIINRELDSIRTTIFRQTMFAEFELRTHEKAEAGEPLTAQAFRAIYRELLDDYFGPDFAMDDALELECFRIPHFYRGFYVYKYATGLSAAIALAERVLNGGMKERDDYLNFLKAGCSADPLDILKAAGVDMEKPEPIVDAMKRFETLTDELEALLFDQRAGGNWTQVQF